MEYPWNIGSLRGAAYLAIGLAFARRIVARVATTKKRFVANCVFGDHTTRVKWPAPWIMWDTEKSAGRVADEIIHAARKIEAQTSRGKAMRNTTQDADAVASLLYGAWAMSTIK
jgi:hypothetical protein